MNTLNLDAKKVISANLKRLRAEKGLTQKELADKAGLTQSALSHFEAGARWPDYSTIVSICDALGIEHTEIISHPDLLEGFKKFDKFKKDIT